MNPMRSVVAAAVLAAFAAPALASDAVGTAAFTNELYRVDTASGQTTLIGGYKLVDTTEFNMPVLARDPSGTLYGISNSSFISRVYAVNESNAQLTPLHDITIAPVSPAGAAIDPTSGLLYFTNTFGFVPWPALHSMDLATGQVNFLGNIGPNIPDAQGGLAFTPNGNLYALNLSAGALHLIDKTDPLNNSTTIGSVAGVMNLNNGGTIFYDPQIGSLVGYEVAGSRFFTIDAATGTATPLPGIGAVSPVFADVVGSACQGSAVQYGAGCAGSGNFVPTLSLSGCPEVGSSVFLSIDDGLGAATALLFFGTGQASIPVGAGCTFLLTPVLPPFLAFPLGGAGAGNGSASIPATIPANAAGLTITTQVFIADPFNFLGASASNAVQVSVP